LFINFAEIIYTVIICYFAGSIPFGLLLSIFFEKNDPRFCGSNNIGATNIARLSGWKLGLSTLLLDILKSFLIIYFFYLDTNLIGLAIISVFLGHLFPVWLKFKGGKGVAVYIGILLAYNFPVSLVFLIVWAFIAIIFKYSSLSALSASLIALNVLIFTNDPQLKIFILITILIFLKHINNIRRLILGNETKLNFKNKI